MAEDQPLQLPDSALGITPTTKGLYQIPEAQPIHLRDVAISRALDIASKHPDEHNGVARIYLSLIRAGRTDLVPQATLSIDQVEADDFRYRSRNNYMSDRFRRELGSISGVQAIKTPLEQELEKGDFNKVIDTRGRSVWREHVSELTSAYLGLGQLDKAVDFALWDAPESTVYEGFSTIIANQSDNLDAVMQRLHGYWNNTQNFQDEYTKSKKYLRFTEAYLEFAKAGRKDALDLAWEAMQHVESGYRSLRKNDPDYYDQLDKYTRYANDVPKLFGVTKGTQMHIISEYYDLDILTEIAALGKTEATSSITQRLESIDRIIDTFYQQTNIAGALLKLDQHQRLDYRNGEEEALEIYGKLRQDQARRLAIVARRTKTDVWDDVFKAANHPALAFRINNSYFSFYSSLLEDSDLNRVNRATELLRDSDIHDPFQKLQVMVAIDKRSIELTDKPHFLHSEADTADYQLKTPDEHADLAEQIVGPDFQHPRVGLEIYPMLARVYKDREMFDHAMEIYKSSTTEDIKSYGAGRNLLDAALDLGDIETAMKIVEMFGEDNDERSSGPRDQAYIDIDKALGYAHIVERTSPSPDQPTNPT